MAVSSAPKDATIRPRTDDDLSGCISVLRRVYEQDGYPVQGVENALPFLRSDSIQQGWIAEVDGQVAGHVALGKASTEDVAVRAWWLKHPDDRIAVLERLFVDPDHRGIGLAAQLINSAVQWSHDAGLHLVLFVLAKDKTAERLYAKLGWTHFATSRYHYGEGREMDALCFVAPSEAYAPLGLCSRH